MNEKMPNREEVEQIRKQYPAGCRIVLDEMADKAAPPAGTQATVTGVDDIGSIMPAFDCGGSLHILYQIDRCHKIQTETEAKVTLDHYGKHQPDEDARCPRCGDMMFGKRVSHALSRWADITVCDRCGTEEALEAAGLKEKQPLMEWAAIVIPQSGGGAWRR